MNKNFLLASSLAPELEQHIWDVPANEVVVLLFQKLIAIMPMLRHVALFIVPIEFKRAFYADNKMKAILQLIESDSQINIIFARNFIFTCPSPNLARRFRPLMAAPEIYKLIIGLISTKRLPFLFGNHEDDLSKEVCNDCTSELLCKDEFILSKINIEDIDKIKIRVRQVARLVFNKFYKVTPDISPLDIKVMTFLVACFHNIDDKMLPTLSSFRVCKSFCSDILHNRCDINDVIFSIFRSCAFPSATDPNSSPSPYSIDWHNNNPRSRNGFLLYRVDVVSACRTGRCSSGLCRILMGIKNNIKHYVAYTASHNFSSKQISRVDIVDTDFE